MLRVALLLAFATYARATTLVEHKCFTDLIPDESEELSCSGLGLKGPIPLEIVRLTRLQHIFLADNAFTGSVPDPIWNHLKRLQHIDLSGNKLGGGIPKGLSHARLKKLAHLYLNDNDLTGGIGSHAFTNMPALKYLSLSGNRLSGGLPGRLATLPSLTVLRLQDNELGGAIPKAWQDTNITLLDLSGNHLTDCVPRCIGLCADNPDLSAFPCRVTPQRAGKDGGGGDATDRVCPFACPAPTTAPTHKPRQKKAGTEEEEGWGKSTTAIFIILLCLVLEILCVVTYMCSGGDIKARIRRRLDRHREARHGSAWDRDIPEEEGRLHHAVHSFEEGLKAAGHSVKAAASHVSLKALAQAVGKLSPRARGSIWTRASIFSKSPPKSSAGEGEEGAGGGGGGEEGQVPVAGEEGTLVLGDEDEEGTFDLAQA